MTALQMINMLQINKEHVLWINHERREAAYHGHSGGCSEVVDYNDAMMARSDTGIVIAEERDGEILAAR